MPRLRLPRAIGVALAVAALAVATVASDAQARYPNQGVMPLQECGTMSAAAFVGTTPDRSGSTYVFATTLGKSGYLALPCAKARPLLKRITAMKCKAANDLRCVIVILPESWQCFVVSETAKHPWGGVCTNGPFRERYGFAWNAAYAKSNNGIKAGSPIPILG